VHACGVTTTGDTFCWGQNTSGELGAGTNTQWEPPVFALDLTP
jgi:alpha-tubulin suppressor-like RCC1 family protein